MPKFLPFTLIGVALLLLCSQGYAHSTLKNTVPASGSILPASPEKLVINFNENARLTTIAVETADSSERKLDYMPKDSSMSFSIAKPNFMEGRNEVKWKALSKDGHPVEGSIIIVIKEGATPTPATAEKSTNHSHQH